MIQYFLLAGSALALGRFLWTPSASTVVGLGLLAVIAAAFEWFKMRAESASKANDGVGEKRLVALESKVAALAVNRAFGGG